MFGAGRHRYSQNGLAAVGRGLTSKAELGLAIPASGVLCVCHSRLLGTALLCMIPLQTWLAAFSKLL